jgi:DNA-binding NarL/FixJ family response regulator
MRDRRRSPDRKVVEGPWMTAEDERVLKLLTEGRTTQEIADELGISPSTVRRRVEMIAKKTGLSAGIPPLDA